MVDAWNYAIEAVRTHPFNALTLVFAIVAMIISILAWRASQRQVKAGERQATAAETQLDLQAKTLQSQAEALRAQAEETARALELAERNAAAAERSANYAAQSIEVGRESMYRSLRAYVTIEQIEPAEWMGFSKAAPGILGCDKMPEHALVTVVNTGQTPARHVQIQYNMDVLEEFPKSAAEYEEHYRTWMPTDLGRNQKRTVRAKLLGTGIEEKLRAASEDPHHQLSVFGRIKYLDMFSNIENVTEFCFVYDARLKHFVPTGPVNSVK